MGIRQRRMRFGMAMALVTGMACAAGAQTSPAADDSREDGAAVRAATFQGTEAPVKDDLFTGTEKFAKNASDVTEVTMDPDTLDMVNGNGAKRAHNMILNVVRTYTYDKPGMYRMEDVDEFRRKLNTGDWHCPVHTRDLKSGESTDICNRHRTDGLVESAIITVEPKGLTFIHTIRKKGEGESSLGPEGVWQMGLPGAVPSTASLASVLPTVNTEMQSRLTEMRVHGAEIARAASLRSLPTRSDPGMQAKMQQLQEGMKQLAITLQP